MVQGVFSKNRTKTHEQFLLDLEKVHGDKYKPLSEYTTQRTELDFECLLCGNVFTMIPMRLLHSSSGCECNTNEGGFNYKTKGYLYYVKVVKDGVTAYKIGITNKTIKARFRTDSQYIEVLSFKEYENGTEAHTEEQRILKEYKEFKYIGEALLKTGNTEMFNKDVLGLDVLPI